MTDRFLKLTLFLALAGCSAGVVGQALPSDSADTLQTFGEQPDALGELVYDGRVQDRGDDATALFRYERRVADVDGGLVGSHLTYSTEDEPVLIHRATYSSEYVLQSFEEIHGQTGLVGSVVVEPDGSAVFDVVQDGEKITATEGAGDPVHVGPTLFGFALENWDGLVEGDVEHLRFVVMEDARTYRFALRLESTDAETTAFKMTASNALVRLAVPSMRITFDTASRSPVRFEGLVPPMVGPTDDLRKLDARVDYTVGGAYR